MTNCENTTQNPHNNHVCNLSSVYSFKEIIDLSKWNEIYNCDDFEFLPYRTNAYSECNAALFRSYNDTAVEDGVTQNVYFSDTDVHVLSANIHILDGGIQSDVHGVTAGIRLQICSNNNILAQSNLLTQANITAHVRLPFIANANETIQIKICINGRGAAIVDTVQIK